jgi:hypothetical protein
LVERRWFRPARAEQVAALEDENIPQSRLLKSMGVHASGFEDSIAAPKGKKPLMMIGAAVLVIIGIATGFVLAKRSGNTPPQMTPSGQR